MAGVSLSQVTKRFARSGTVVVDISLDIADGEFFTILGPSGCGKTTTLRMIAGFEEPTEGRILFGEQDVTNLAVNKRGVGIVFQNYALFPHMSVGKNVAFGLKARKVDKDEVARRVAEALEQVQLGGQEAARVDELSGGMQQRVALARAIVIRPEILLLDEPLSNLDAKLREETRSALRKLHQETGKTSIYVTHDQAEALAMSTRIAVMSKGTVHQVGTPDEVYTTPATRFVAGFLGTNNIVDGLITQVTADGRVEVALDAGHSVWARADNRTAGVAVEVGAPVGLAVRSEDVRTAGDAELDNVIEAVVDDVEFVGARLEVTAETDLGPIRLELPPRSAAAGERLRLRLPADSVRLVEAAEPGGR